MVADVPERWQSIATPRRLGLIGRSLATRGQAVFLIDTSGANIELVPATDWDVTTRGGEPVAYRLQIPEAGGGHQVTALAAEVVDVRINADVTTPWHGVSPLRKSSLTADVLAAIECGMGEVMAGTWGSQVLPTPELQEEQRTQLEDKLGGRRGGLTPVESTRVNASGGPMPVNDWVPSNLTPDLRGLELGQHWEAVRSTILAAFGVPPILFSSLAQNAALREGQRHAVLWTMAPIAKLASAELAAKLDDPDFKLDLITPLAAADSAGRARAVNVLTSSSMSLNDALELVGWTEKNDAS